MAEAEVIGGVGMYRALARRLANVPYKRGQFQGDAPLGPRWKSHLRVTRVDHRTMGVILHKTRIITAYADGEVVIDCGGWSHAPTTREAVTEAARLYGTHGLIYTVNYNGYKNTVIAMQGRRHVYYDGMRLDHTGSLLSPAAPAYSYVADREARNDWRKAMAGAKQVFMGLLGVSGVSMLTFGDFTLPTDPRDWSAIPEADLVKKLLHRAYWHHKSSHAADRDDPKWLWRSIEGEAFEHSSMNRGIEVPLR
jgi:hypothetical protein